MTKQSGDLSTFDWVSLPGARLVQLKLDPQDRILYTGHPVVLRSQYLESIGNWGGLDNKELLNSRDRSKAPCHVSLGNFHQFKHRRQLFDGKQFASIHGPQNWRRPELSYSCIRKAQKSFKASSGTLAPIGVAAAHAVELGVGKQPIGLLPVEVVLWSRVFHGFLSHYSMAYREWEGLHEDKKAEYWHHHEDPPWALEHIAHAPAVLHLDPILSAVG